MLFFHYSSGTTDAGKFDKAQQITEILSIMEGVLFCYHVFNGH